MFLLGTCWDSGMRFLWVLIIALELSKPCKHNDLVMHSRHDDS